MPEFTGSAGIVVTVNGSALAGVRSAVLDERGGLPRVDVTVSTDTTMQYVNDLPESAIAVLTVEGLLQAGTADLVRSLAVGQNNIVIQRGLEGSATNKPKETGTVAITNMRTGSGFRDAQPFTIEFTQNTGAFARGNW